jgi:hypothetical protein
MDLAKVGHMPQDRGDRDLAFWRRIVVVVDVYQVSSNEIDISGDLNIAQTLNNG